MGRGRRGVLGRSQGGSRQREGRPEPSEHSAEGSGGPSTALEGGEGQQGHYQGPPGLIIKGSVVTFLKQYLRSPGWEPDCRGPGISEEMEVGGQRSHSECWWARDTRSELGWGSRASLWH